MSRRTAGSMSPLLFTLTSVVFWGQFVLAADLPSASGDTPYSQVSGEEPVKPGAGKTGKTILPASDIPATKSHAPVKPERKVNVKQRSEPAAVEADLATVGEPLAPGMIEIL